MSIAARRASCVLALMLSAGTTYAQQAPVQQPANQWFAVPSYSSFVTGDTWTVAGETHRLYGVQACLRGTVFTNDKGVKVDCGEASLAMLVSLIRDLKPLCYTAAWQAATKTRFVICVSQPITGQGAGSRLDLGTALISTGWAFAAVNGDGAPVHIPYMVAQEVAKKSASGLWHFKDVPDPNAIIMRSLKNGTDPVSPPVAPALQ